MLTIALTGGIGSGKSTVAQYFAKLKAPVLDADKICHELLKPGTGVLRKIIAHFGKNYLTPQGLLNRYKLRHTIFQDPCARRWLEDLLHRKIYLIMQQRLKKLHAPYCILVIPLLYEALPPPFAIDRILLIDCLRKLQIERCQKRPGYTTPHIQAILKTQVSRHRRLKHATDTITNTASLRHLQLATKQMHNFYLNLAQKYDKMQHAVVER